MQDGFRRYSVGFGELKIEVAVGFSGGFAKVSGRKARFLAKLFGKPGRIGQLEGMGDLRGGQVGESKQAARFEHDPLPNGIRSGFPSDLLHNGIEVVLRNM